MSTAPPEGSCVRCRHGKRKCTTLEWDPNDRRCDRCIQLGVTDCLYSVPKKRGRPPVSLEVTASRAEGSSTSRGPDVPTQYIREISPFAARSTTSPINQSTQVEGSSWSRPTGAFSLAKVLDHGGKAVAGSFWLADAFTNGSTSQDEEQGMEDVVAAGIVPEFMVPDCVAFYFQHLNAMSSILDPVLHTAEAMRQASPVLFTMVVCFACKGMKSPLYPAVQKYVKKLLAQAYEIGINSVEIVQALALYVFAADPEDRTVGRKLGYAVQSAIELGMHKQGPRPLPEEEMARRKALNPERTWYFLVIADHRLHALRRLPKMISTDFRRDPLPWLLEHDGANFCPSEVGLVAFIQLSRLLDTFDSLFAQADISPHSHTFLQRIELDIQSWGDLWLNNSGPLAVPHPTVALMRFYYRVLGFQLQEAALCVTIRLRALMPTSTSVSFDDTVRVLGKCVSAAQAVLVAISEELVATPHLVYPFDTMFTGTACAAIWLAQNMAVMDEHQQRTSIALLERAKEAVTAASSGPQLMAPFCARLLEHLFAGVSRRDLLPQPNASAIATPASDAGRPDVPPFVVASFGGALWQNSAFETGIGPLPRNDEDPEQMFNGPEEALVTGWPSSLDILPPSYDLFPAADDPFWANMFRLQ